MSKLQDSIVRNITGGAANNTQPQDRDSGEFTEAGFSGNEATAEEPSPRNFYESIESDAKDELDPEPIPFQAGARSSKSAPKAGGSGGKLLVGSALVLSLLALGVGGLVGVKQFTGEAELQSSMVGLSESITELDLKDADMTQSISQMRNSIAANEGRLAEIGQIRSDIASVQEALGNIQTELSGIKTTLGTHRSVLDEHRLDIDNMAKDVKTLKDRPARTIVKQVPVQEQQASKTEPPRVATLEGATVASIDLWGTEPYVVLQDQTGGWVPMTVGDYYQGWRLHGAVDGEAIFKAGGKVRRLSVEN